MSLIGFTGWNYQGVNHENNKNHHLINIISYNGFAENQNSERAEAPKADDCIIFAQGNVCVLSYQQALNNYNQALSEKTSKSIASCYAKYKDECILTDTQAKTNFKKSRQDSYYPSYYSGHSSSSRMYHSYIPRVSMKSRINHYTK
ncbi:hypothetical protein [Kangiella sp. TOML190]|uniref:hypothetical protein n=1 Tax=Kangiella sp. TOML190 TaxID=2931351 RepID=UPI00203CC754|nr:hypothetical protein [Kangiella sp. TOML190]